MSTEFKQAIESAVQEGKLSTDSAENVGRLMRESKQVPRMVASIQELVDTCEWEELNDRFFRTLAFGTGGVTGQDDWQSGDEGGDGQADGFGSAGISSGRNELYE